MDDPDTAKSGEAAVTSHRLIRALIETMHSLTHMASIDWKRAGPPNERPAQLVADFLDGAVDAGEGEKVARLRSMLAAHPDFVYPDAWSRSWDRAFDGSASGLSADSAPDETALLEERLTELIAATRDHSSVFMTLEKLMASQQARDRTILASLLTAAVSSFEEFIRSIASLVHRLEPGLTAGHEFRLQRLRELGAEELEAEAIEFAVSSVMFDSRSWRAWFAERLACSLSELSFDPAGFDEVLARRNAHVHAGGSVNRQYLQAIADETDLSIGDELRVTAEYVATACEHLTCVGLRALALSLRRVGVADEAIVALTLAVPIGHDLPEVGYWRAIPQLVKTLNSAECRLEWKHDGRVFAAWARQELGEDVSGEVEDWDVENVGASGRLGRAILMGDDEAATLWATGVAGGDFSEHELRQNPFYWAHRELLGDGRGDSTARPEGHGD